MADVGGTVSWRHLTYHSAYDVTLDIYQIINNKTILKTHNTNLNYNNGKCGHKIEFSQSRRAINFQIRGESNRAVRLFLI